MLAMLGGFFFEIQSNGYQKLKETLECDYAVHEKALNFREQEAVGAYKEEFEMDGTLILQSIYSLELLKLLAKKKKPVLLVLPSGFCYWVTIEKLVVDSSRFLNGGAALKRKFNVILKRYYYADSILSQIFNTIR